MSGQPNQFRLQIERLDYGNKERIICDGMCCASVSEDLKAVEKVMIAFMHMSATGCFLEDEMVTAPSALDAMCDDSAGMFYAIIDCITKTDMTVTRAQRRYQTKQHESERTGSMSNGRSAPKFKWPIPQDPAYAKRKPA